jgi:two-component system, LytTR family, response regulator
MERSPRAAVTAGPNLGRPHGDVGHAIPGLRILIADHAVRARRRLRRYLAEVETICSIAESDSGPATAVEIERQRPDILFLDADLPGAATLCVVDAVRADRAPAVIVMSGDEGMLSSLEGQRRLCLRKPIRRETAHAALDRARRPVRAAGRDVERGGEADLRQGIADRLVVRSAGRVLAVSVERIEWLEARDNYVHVHVSGETHVVRETLSGLEARLDPHRFVRVHRGAIVNVHGIEELRSAEHGWKIRLRGGTTVPVGRNYRSGIRNLLRT